MMYHFFVLSIHPFQGSADSALEMQVTPLLTAGSLQEG